MFESAIISRRRFIQTSLTMIANVLMLPKILQGSTYQRQIYIYNTHTGKHFKGVFASGDEYNPDALNALQILLADRRNGQQHVINPRLYDLLYILQQRFETAKPFELICGYRSPQSNAAMHRRSSGVALKSLHMQGQAVDIALPGVKLVQLRDAAKKLRAGGVGYYPTSGFIHMDIRKKPAYW